MFQKIKENILRKKLKNLLALDKEIATNPQKIMSVGIVTSQEVAATIDVVAEVEKILGVKNIEIVIFRKFDKKETLSDCYFSEKEINWNGQFTNPKLQEFIEQPFHLLIGYFQTNNVFLETLVVQSKALFKVGFTNVNEALYVLEVSEKITAAVSFLSELKNYLQILKKI